MSDTVETSEVEELGQLVKSSFPDLRCLRCGNEEFYVISEKHGGLPGHISPSIWSSPLMDREHPLLTLACSRCGYVEQHLTGFLRAADKPISRE